MPLPMNVLSSSAHKQKGAALPPSAKRGIFCALALLWILIDQIVKLSLDPLGVGTVIYETQAGIIDLVLVHNTGGAWGMFGGATTLLGVVSLAVCVLIVAYLFCWAKGSSLLAYISLSLVFAGGLGNALDRFWHGYVIDFISFSFIDFPVFNFADIGVTVGVSLFIISLVLEGRRAEGDATDQPRDDK